MIAIYWGAVLCCLPFLFRYDFINDTTRYLDIRTTKDFFFLFFVFLSLVLFGIGKLDKKIHIPCIVLSVMAFFVHSQYSVNANFQFIHFFAGILLLIQLSSKWKREYNSLIKVFFQIMCITQCLSVFAQYYNHDFYKTVIRTFIDKDMVKIQKVVQEIVEKKADDPDPIIGTLGNSNLSAALIATTAPSLFSAPLLLIPVVIALTLLKTSAAFAALFAAFMVFLSFKIKSRKKRLVFYGLLAIIGTIILLIGTKYIGFIGDSGRFEVWEKTLKLIKPGDIIGGQGLGSFADFFVRNYGLVHWSKFNHIHNEFLELFYAFGVVGVCCVAYLLLHVRKTNSWCSCCLVAILCNCFFNFYFHISCLALIGILTYVILIWD